MIIYDIPSHISGNQWKGIAGITITRNNSALDLTGASAVMKVKTQIDAPTVVQFSSDDGSISFVSPASAGMLDIPPVVVDIPPGNYQYSLTIKLSSQEIKTFLQGSWTIVNEINSNYPYYQTIGYSL